MKILGIKYCLFSLLFLFSSCGQKPELTVYTPSFRIISQPSFQERGIMPEGTCTMSFFIGDENGFPLESSEKIKEITIKGPDGNLFGTIDAKKPFQPGTSKIWSGYILYGLKEPKLLWSLFYSDYHSTKIPPQGTYTITLISETGQESHETIRFESPDKDPLSGYPEKINYDPMNRKIIWQPVKGATGYKVYVFKGKKTLSLDYSSLIYSSDRQWIEKSFFTLPSSVLFEKGNSYYITVEAYYSPDKNPVHAVFSHIQDQEKEIASFQIEDKEDLSQTPLSYEDIQYPFPVKYLELPEGKLAYIDEGNGVPVLFIHGLSTNLTSFEVFFDGLLKQGYRVIAVDLLGYGKSSKNSQIQYTLPLQSEAVFKLIQYLKLKKTVLTGHSMGGAVSLLLALEHPETLAGLFLIAPGGFFEYSDIQKSYFKSFYDEGTGKRYSDPVVAKSYYEQNVYQWNSYMEIFFQLRKRMMKHSEWKKLQKTIKDSSFSFIETSGIIAGRLTEIRVPVFILLGKQDKIIPAEELLTEIKLKKLNWPYQVFDQCGHMIQFEHKKESVDSLLEFLRHESISSNQ
ncbi:MAG: hypothetical protein A2Y41_13940 [Spirochaetes bacterium GWB1_36_13]|nr:MAG: hypothetical protein A2Y41_13940 [Spirochaetes bacterium GWB1_36_13]